jgi:enolase
VSAISRILAREVLDSRGQPTVEAEVHTSDGAHGRAIVPSGASTGAFEAHELRDQNEQRYDGRGVRRAVKHVNEIIAPALVGLDPADQRQVDAVLLALDPSPGKEQLGANSMLAASLAVAHAAADSRSTPLFIHLNNLLKAVLPSAPAPRMPVPMINMISGGLHAGGNLDFQDVLIIPRGEADIETQLEWAVRIYRRLGRLLAEAGYEGCLVGDEGGYGPRLASNREAIEFTVRAIEAAELQPGDQVGIALDVASTHFYDGTHYQLSKTGERFTSEQMVDLLAKLVAAFPIESIEDGLAEEDWAGWQLLTRKLGKQVRLVGDDLFTTNPERLHRGIQLAAANSVLVKVNQIGTLTETFDTIALARQHGYAYVVSARSGETEDHTIADLAVATAAEHIKIGSIVRGERLAKYNQLLRIAEQLA